MGCQTMSDNPRVMFLIRSLERGGAERQLVVLAAGLHREGWPVTVVCFYAGGSFQRELEQAGVPVIDLAKHGRWDVFGFLWRLFGVFRKVRPDLVHGYLPVPNLLALLSRLVRPGTRVLWGVRASYMDLSRYDRLSRAAFWLQCRLARYVDLIIANSAAGMEYHVAHGFPQPAMRVIPNGIDTTRFRYDAAGRERLRRDWGVPESAVLVGQIGRLDPMKGHPTFLRAAARLALIDPNWRFVCVGDGASDYRAELERQATELGLGSRLIWAGARNDMSAVYSALDVFVSSSYGEGFPNAVAEAMACGRSCVVTDVGDSAAIVGSLGEVVEADDPLSLSHGVERAHQRMAKDGLVLEQELRARIKSHYNIANLVHATGIALRSVSSASPSNDALS